MNQMREGQYLHALKPIDHLLHSLLMTVVKEGYQMVQFPSPCTFS